MCRELAQAGSETKKASEKFTYAGNRLLNQPSSHAYQVSGDLILTLEGS